MPPQDMTGKPLIRISIGSNDFTHTPETEAAGKFGFFGGKRYAYTITVKPKFAGSFCFGRCV